MNSTWPSPGNNGYTWRVPPELGDHMVPGAGLYGPDEFNVTCELAMPLHVASENDGSAGIPKSTAVPPPTRPYGYINHGGFYRPPALKTGDSASQPPARRVPPPPPAPVVPQKKYAIGAPIGAPPLPPTSKAGAAAKGPVPPRTPPPRIPAWDDWGSDCGDAASSGDTSRFVLSVQHTCK